MNTDKTLRFATLLLTLVITSGAFAQDRPVKTLYERLGRYDAISTIADAYLKGIRADPQFARFTGRGADSLRRARQLLKDQLCAMTGGPCVYVGRDMKTAHGGLAITDAEWAANMKYMAAALEESHVSPSDKREFLALVESLRPAIVEK
jgi:hemoglobin